MLKKDPSFTDIVAELDADILGLQETKLQEGQVELDLPGYHQVWSYAERKGYSGTAVFTREEPLSVRHADAVLAAGRAAGLSDDELELVAVAATAVLKKDPSFTDIVAELDADILGLQETKLQEGQVELDLPGYHQVWSYAERKGYSGTAVFTREEPLSVRHADAVLAAGRAAGLSDDELELVAVAATEGRVCALEFERLPTSSACRRPNCRRVRSSSTFPVITRCGATLSARVTPARPCSRARSPSPCATPTPCSQPGAPRASPTTNSNWSPWPPPRVACALWSSTPFGSWTCTLPTHRASSPA